MPSGAIRLSEPLWRLPKHGSLRPDLGGAVLAHNTTLSDLQALVNEDPFVAQEVVRAEILELAPSKAIEPLHFLAEVSAR